MAKGGRVTKVSVRRKVKLEGGREKRKSGEGEIPHVAERMVGEEEAWWGAPRRQRYFCIKMYEKVSATHLQ